MEADIRYGDTARSLVDIFLPDRLRGAPMAVFIHGGYWRALDKNCFSHMAHGLVSQGALVAVPSYDLCPDVGIGQIVEQIRGLCRFLWLKYKRRLLILGHSAGGHLAAAMMATNWQAFDTNLPSDLVCGCVPISSLPDLTPLTRTSINASLNLSDEEAYRLSPLFWPTPRGGKAVIAVGEKETSEYHRQSRELVDHWFGGGMDVRLRIIPSANHFTAIEELPDAGSTMVADAFALTVL